MEAGKNNDAELCEMMMEGNSPEMEFYADMKSRFDQYKTEVDKMLYKTLQSQLAVLKVHLDMVKATNKLKNIKIGEPENTN